MSSNPEEFLSESIHLQSEVLTTAIPTCSLGAPTKGLRGRNYREKYLCTCVYKATHKIKPFFPSETFPQKVSSLNWQRNFCQHTVIHNGLVRESRILEGNDFEDLVIS